MPRRCRAELPSGPEHKNRPAPGPFGLEANIITVPPTPAKSRKFPRRSGESSGEATGRRRRGAITAIFFYDAEQSCRAARAAVHARSVAWRICTTRQSSSSQASTFSRRTRMAWGKHTGGCRQQRFTTRFRTGVNGANKTWSTCTRHQRHTARPSVRNLDKCPMSECHGQMSHEQRAESCAITSTGQPLNTSTSSRVRASRSELVRE